MKKLIYISVCLAAGIAACASGCKKTVNYAEYISEKRYDIFYCSEGGAEIKIYCSEKESPFNADGIKGNVNPLIEIYASFDSRFNEVTISSSEFTGGEMSYLTVKDCWYISFSGTISADSVSLALTCDGTESGYTLTSVLSDSVMSCEKALEHVTEYNGELFSSMTENNVFRGEIFIRLLYDTKCYYYVGVCGRDGKISAYLTDGETGKIIAERQHSI